MRTKTPPWSLAAVAMLPPIKKASPPNTFFFCQATLSHHEVT